MTDLPKDLQILTARPSRMRLPERIADRPTRIMARPDWVGTHTPIHHYDYRTPVRVVHDHGGDTERTPVGEADPMVCGVVSILALAILGGAFLHSWWVERKRRALRIQRRDRFGY